MEVGVVVWERTDLLSSPWPLVDCPLAWELVASKTAIFWWLDMFLEQFFGAVLVVQRNTLLCPRTGESTTFSTRSWPFPFLGFWTSAHLYRWPIPPTLPFSSITDHLRVYLPMAWAMSEVAALSEERGTPLSPRIMPRRQLPSIPFWLHIIARLQNVVSCWLLLQTPQSYTLCLIFCVFIVLDIIKCKLGQWGAFLQL